MNANEQDDHLYRISKFRCHIKHFICTRIPEDTKSYSIANLINVERMLALLSIRCDDVKNAVTGAYSDKHICSAM